MRDMSRAFDTIDRGLLLQDLSDILNPDELHLASVLILDVNIQVKYNNTTGKIFTPDIGSPQGDCASPIWFIFYLHKALSVVKSKCANPRNINLDIQHDHPYIKKNYVSAPVEIQQDHAYAKRDKTTSRKQKSQDGFIIDQQYADDTSWATTVLQLINYIKEVASAELESKNQQVNHDKTEDYTVTRVGDTS